MSLTLYLFCHVHILYIVVFLYNSSHSLDNGVDINIFLNLTPSQIPILLPTPTFTIGEQLKFMQKYISFMTSNKLVSMLFLSFSCAQDRQ